MDSMVCSMAEDAAKYTGYTWKLNCFSAFTIVVCNIRYVLNLSIKKIVFLPAVMKQMLKYDNCWKGIKVVFVIVDATIQEFFTFILANLFSVSLEALVTNKTITTHNPATSKPASEEETN